MTELEKKYNAITEVIALAIVDAENVLFEMPDINSVYSRVNHLENAMSMVNRTVFGVQAYTTTVAHLGEQDD